MEVFRRKEKGWRKIFVSLVREEVILSQLLVLLALHCMVWLKPLSPPDLSSFMQIIRKTNNWCFHFFVLSGLLGWRFQAVIDTEELWVAQQCGKCFTLTHSLPFHSWAWIFPLLQWCYLVCRKQYRDKIGGFLPGLCCSRPDKNLKCGYESIFNYLSQPCHSI